jgi:aspartate carbamoyltransferase catalytic subunit
MPPSTLPARFRYPAGSLLSVEQLSIQEILQLLQRAAEMQQASASALSQRFPHKRVVLLFYEASTRTRVSFQFAAKALGAMTAVISAGSSSIEKGESLIDTGYTLQSTGADVIVLRHPSSGAAHLLARHIEIPVVNAGDGMHEHPSQALLDALTMQKHGKKFEGLKITIVGDILHSRVARSNAMLLSKFGAQVTFCGPPELLPEVAATLAPGVGVERDFESALRQVDAVMMLRVQKERLAGLNLDVLDYTARYQLTQQRLTLAKPDAIVFHPGPMIRGMEITAEVADGPQSVIREQVANGVPTRMAILARAFESAEALA